MEFEFQIAQINFFTPIQFLGPSPNGMYAIACLCCLFSLLNLSGSNFSGSGKISGSFWMADIGIIIKVSAGIVKFVPGILYSFSHFRGIFSIAGYMRRVSKSK